MDTSPQSCEKYLAEFSAALEDLKILVTKAQDSTPTDSRGKELITQFETTHELALQVIGKYFQKMGKKPFSGSRDATIEAFHADLIDDGTAWLDMVIDRIKYNPLYELSTQDKFIENIRQRYTRLLERFENSFQRKLEE